MKRSAIDKFVENMHKINRGENINFYDSYVDSMFEYICSALLKDIRDKDIWYDGTADLTVKNIGPSCLEFRGNMHVMRKQEAHWKEPLIARVDMGRESCKDVLVRISCGGFKGEGNIYTMFE